MDQSANVMHMNEYEPSSAEKAAEQVSVMDNDVTLADLLRRVVIQDQSAFEQFYDRTVQNVYGLAMKITGETTTAEEVVGDVYLQAWEQANRFNESKGSVLAWLMMITRSRSLDARRKFIREQAVPWEEVEQIPESTEEIEALLMQMDQYTEVHKALTEVGSVQRQLIALNFFRGYSHQELSDFTGIPLGTVKSHLNRAMKLMRKSLEASRVWAGAVK